MKTDFEVKNNVAIALEEAETKAIHNLAIYKYMNFGYWAACWVHSRDQLHGKGSKAIPSPFGFLVKAAKALEAAKESWTQGHGYYPESITEADGLVISKLYDRYGCRDLLQAIAVEHEHGLEEK